MIEWNEDSDRKSLIAMGVRQVDKTYLIKNLFAEQFYKDKYVRIDCKKSRGALNSLDEFRMHNKNTLVIKVSSNRYGYDEKNKI